jgi:hypothetical protein
MGVSNLFAYHTEKKTWVPEAQSSDWVLEQWNSNIELYIGKLNTVM